MPAKIIKTDLNYIQPREKWWTFNLEQVMEKLNNTEQGLTSEEAEERLNFYGFNQLPKKEAETSKEILKRQLRSALVYVLLAAGAISFILGDTIDALIILAVGVINVSVGFVQEFKTSRALEALEKAAVSYAKVLRDGEEKLLPAHILVPGDVVAIYAGDKIPADARLFKEQQLKINEAILTGESELREKHRGVLGERTILPERANMVFMGTTVMSGSALGIVVATGSRAELGQIAALVGQVKDGPTPLQQKINRFANFLTKLVLFLCGLIFITGLIFKHGFVEMLTTAVAISVAAIPEGLAITVTVVLAIGMQRILKKGAIVKNLLATETLGSTTVIAVDKTGTLTTGEMEVMKIVTTDTEFNWQTGAPELTPEAAEEQNLVLRIGVLCNNAYAVESVAEGQKKLLGDLTERALFVAGEHLGLQKELLEKQYHRLDEVPFNSTDKFMMTLNRFDENHNIIYLKGAPERVLLFANYLYSHHLKDHVEFNNYRREKMVQWYEQMSKDGLRVVAVAYKKVPRQITLISQKPDFFRNDFGYEITPASVINMRDLYTNFVLVGLVGIMDPVRGGVPEAVATTRAAGVKTIMITGDNKFTAKTIAQNIGLKIDDGHVVDGETLSAMSDTDLIDQVSNFQVYARVTPADKLRIVKAWQEKGAVVAMTGDGINDAPALKQANIGVALGTATDVAKEAADMVLIKNDFKTIVEAVRQGRVIFENIKKIILYFLSDSLVEMMVIIFSLLVGWPLPIIASQIIWVNLIDDSFLGLSLTNDPIDFEVMAQPPQKITAEILNKKRKIIIGVTSLAVSFFILLSFWLFWQGADTNIVLARTVAFALLGLDSIFCVLSLRNLQLPVWRTKFWQNFWLLGAMALGLFLQIWAIHSLFWQKILGTVSLNWWQWCYVGLTSLVVVGIIEIIKKFFYQKSKK